jgi:hypothetical protein
MAKMDKSYDEPPWGDNHLNFRKTNEAVKEGRNTYNRNSSSSSAFAQDNKNNIDEFGRDLYVSDKKALSPNETESDFITTKTTTTRRRDRSRSPSHRLSKRRQNSRSSTRSRSPSRRRRDHSSSKRNRRTRSSSSRSRTSNSSSDERSAAEVDASSESSSHERRKRKHHKRHHKSKKRSKKKHRHHKRRKREYNDNESSSTKSSSSSSSSESTSPSRSLSKKSEIRHLDKKSKRDTTKSKLMETKGILPSSSSAALVIEETSPVVVSQQQPKRMPPSRLGTGTITSNAAVVKGYATKFRNEIEAKDGLLIRQGKPDEEFRVVRFVLSDTSLSLSTPFSMEVTTPSPFHIVPNPNKHMDIHSQAGTNKSTNVPSTSTDAEQQLSREELLDKRMKSKTDRMC